MLLLDSAFTRSVGFDQGVSLQTHCQARDDPENSVFGLRWRSLYGDYFLIRDSAWNGKLLEDATKTGERRVYIPPSTRAAILRWRKKAKDASPEALVFSVETWNTDERAQFS